MTLYDRFGRPVTNLRISLTQDCNFRCFFCHREGQHFNARLELTPAEIERLVRIASRLGIMKVKLTGGEPTVRSDIIEIVKRIKPYVKDLSMTTNGSRLKELAKPLAEAGLDRVNVSLHSLRPDVYRKITGVDMLDTVLEGIEEAVKYLSPVKLNMTVMRGLNDAEIWEMIDFAAKTGAILQLIELEAPREMTHTGFFRKYFYPLKPVERELEKRAVEVRERRMHRRKKYFVPTDYGIAEVEVVRAMHNTVFCANCTRLRVTSDGKFKTCLLRKNDLVDFASALRSGASDAELVGIFREVVQMREPYWK
ncbi:molybdenum cofactor biosynthesis protein A2 [Thermococcus cleftensis]|uniref:Probable GTP 3',8-cyclase n=1 Tax=Thermococcus cleftensis (strain DSM 27260 / KACC 17922 / CL1) TaxID=163003 RepID=I3ZUY2_THECF|nr:GTP 3',8-cyclase MoaA [Thermococcus cleftensis]AFL95516.1 molybdenum cofactor biosynthesis protein A2 [Thermococcus cleftensis]